MSKPPGFSKLIAVDFQAGAGAVQLTFPAFFARVAVSPCAAVVLYRCMK